ncbi:hypothetical protein GCWU000182_00370 [Abiotrophia defectiva ATCC 49176]|uniref:Uncharacterized protein n=1 Tax=Abiotrophia defectiva ATCC 49176 TaxID=592010 RepID=W1Q4W1_ABIDE|nr:hypothetical protein GCWU000182_00370 [Abiotrophia defectiva ATCC 49176]
MIAQQAPQGLFILNKKKRAPFLLFRKGARLFYGLLPSGSL